MLIIFLIFKKSSCTSWVWVPQLIFKIIQLNFAFIISLSFTYALLPFIVRIKKLFVYGKVNGKHLHTFCDFAFYCFSIHSWCLLLFLFFLLHNCEICQFTQEKLDLAFTLQDISINFHFSLITRAYAVVYIYSTFLFSHFAPLHVEICFKKLEELFNLFFFYSNCWVYLFKYEKVKYEIFLQRDSLRV